MLVRSYRSAFILLFTLLLVLTTAAVAYNAYRRAAQVTLGLSADLIDEMAGKVAERTAAILEDAHAYLETNALVVSAEGLAAGREPVFRLFWRQLELSPQLLSIFAAEPGGGFLQVRNTPQLVTRYIDRRGERAREQVVYRDRDYAPIAHIEGGGLYDPRERPWYSAALAAGGKVSWSTVYRIAAVERPGITAAKTVYGADGEAALVLGVDIALQGLSDFLADQTLAKGAEVMIVDDQDRLVAYPYRLKLRERPADAPQDALPTVDELQDQALIRAYRSIRDSTPTPGRPAGESSGALKGFEVTRTGGVNYIARIHQFPFHWGDGWKLFVVVPELSLLSSAQRLLAESAVISLIILVVALLLVSLLAFKLFRPLHKLVKNTDLIQQMRFAEVEPVRSRFVEIRSMSAALCAMKQSLQTLEKYVPAAVARGLMESGSEAQPGAEVRELTLICGGMAQFGRLCSTLPPERICALLTDQLDRFTRILMRLRATVDDYLGESLLAFWGAPAVVEDGPSRACQAVLQCLKAESELARADDYPHQAAANQFAIHQGPGIVGNIGSQRYLAYTAVGDHVELTWRLKQANRLYGTRAIVTAPIRAAVAGDFWFRWLDRLQPQQEGADPLDIYELQGERGQPLPAEEQLLSRAYEKALETLIAGDFEAADLAFAQLQREHPRDLALNLMRRRCAAHSIAPCAPLGELESDPAAPGALLHPETALGSDSAVGPGTGSRREVAAQVGTETAVESAEERPAVLGADPAPRVVPPALPGGGGNDPC